MRSPLTGRHLENQGPKRHENPLENTKGPVFLCTLVWKDDPAGKAIIDPQTQILLRGARSVVVIDMWDGDGNSGLPFRPQHTQT